MKRKIFTIFLIVLLAGIAIISSLVVWAARFPRYQDNPELKAELEKVYGIYLQSIQNEDCRMLLSVLTSKRVADLTHSFELNGMTFPDDYFTAFKEYSPRLPPTDKFRYVAVTKSGAYANLIYVGNMKGYLRKNVDEQRFLVIQFEIENQEWKYAAVVDPPASMVPHLEDRLADGKLYFLKFKPFKPEKIELIP